MKTNTTNVGFSHIVILVVVIISTIGVFLYIDSNSSENDLDRISKNSTEENQTIVNDKTTDEVQVKPSIINEDENNHDVLNVIYIDGQEESLVNTGIIEGSLSYPSEYIPEQTICAENLDEDITYCTRENIVDMKYFYGTGYRLVVPQGRYFVYAILGIDHSDWSNVNKIYYSEFVTCGLNVGCLSHDPISVEVLKGETIVEIDPQDWYNY